MPSHVLVQENIYYIKHDEETAAFQNCNVHHFPALGFWNMLCLCWISPVYFCWYWNTLLQGNPMQDFSYFSMSCVF